MVTCAPNPTAPMPCASARRRRHGMGAAPQITGPGPQFIRHARTGRGQGARRIHRAGVGNRSTSPTSNGPSSAFASNDSHDSDCGPTPRRWFDVPAHVVPSVTAKLDGKTGFTQLKAAMAADPRLKLDVQTTATTTASIRSLENCKILGTESAPSWPSRVFARSTDVRRRRRPWREIATMRALGFRGLPVVVAVMLETTLLALLGGLLGAFLAWLIFNGYRVSTLSANFTRCIPVQVSPDCVERTDGRWGLAWSAACSPRCVRAVAGDRRCALLEGVRDDCADGRQQTSGGHRRT